MRPLLVPLLALAFAGCADDLPGDPIDAGLPDAWIEGDAAVEPGDGSTPTDAPIAGGIAPDGAEGAIPADDGDNPADGDTFVRIDALPSEHVTFFLTFEGSADPVLEVLRWDGTDAVSLGLTDAGPGLRTLAVFDPSGPRTFFARVTSSVPLSGTLTITRVPFEDGLVCPGDCAHLLQLPLPNDPLRDGYLITPSTILRYQYGRRDLLMFVRYAGQQQVAAGEAPFVPEDFSQWDGQTPGTDTGSPRHASHQRGKDVDISLYGLDGRSEWRSYCDAVSGADGRECVSGSITNYDAARNAVFFSHFFASGRVTMCFLDEELIEATIPAASVAPIDPALVPLYSDGTHLQHWPNHDNHIHVRVSEEPTGATFTWDLGGSDPIEPP